MYRIVKAGVSCTGVGGWSAIYSTVDDALAAAQDDDTIVITAGAYAAPPNGWVISKRLTIRGEGPGKAPDGSGTALIPHATGNGTVIDITTASATDKEGIVLRDLKIRPTTFLNQARSPAIKISAASGKVVHTLLERIIISGVEGDGFSALGADGGPNAVVLLSFIDCVATGCKGIGFDIGNTTTTLLLNCSSGGNGKYGYRAEHSSALRMINCNNEGNWAIAGGTPVPDVEAGVRLLDCGGFVLIANHNEIGTNNGRTTFVSLEDCFSGSVEGGIYVNASDVQDSRGIRIGSGCRSIRVGPAVWGKVQKLVEIISPAMGCVVEPQSVPNPGASDGKLIIPTDANLGNFGFLPAASGSPRALGLLLPTWTDAGLTTYAPSGDSKVGTILYSGTHGTPRAWNGDEWATVGTLKERVTRSGESNSIASGALANLAGVFRVSVYLVVTTAGAAGSKVKAGISWNDGTAGRGAETDEIVATATNYTSRDFIVRLNTNNLNYYTVVTNGGAPLQYSLFVRVEPLD